MAAWPGGPCPECGDDMPPNLLRCMSCRAWLNSELSRPDPPVPDAFDLPEIPANQVARGAEPGGQYVVCPRCQKELRVANRFLGETVGCKFCEAPFKLELKPGAIRRVGIYLDCPHCNDELRVARKYLGQEVICRLCSGRIRLPTDSDAAKVSRTAEVNT